MTNINRNPSVEDFKTFFIGRILVYEYTLRYGPSAGVFNETHYIVKDLVEQILICYNVKLNREERIAYEYSSLCKLMSSGNCSSASDAKIVSSGFYLLDFPQIPEVQ